MAQSHKERQDRYKERLRRGLIVTRPIECTPAQFARLQAAAQKIGVIVLPWQRAAGGKRKEEKEAGSDGTVTVTRTTSCGGTSADTV